MHIVITAGPTREYIDTVRFISNPSSGKMGYAIARAARARGHRVTLVSGPVDLPAPRDVRTIRVETADEMLAATRKAFKGANAAVFCAAVCDYRPRERIKRKQPKSPHGLRLNLVPTVDIAATLGRVKGRRITVGFALEDHDGEAHALDKMERKCFDAIVLNDLTNLGGDKASAEWIESSGGRKSWTHMTKRSMGARIVQCIEQLVKDRDEARH